MKITCQSCQSKYNVADEKVQGKTVKIRCKKCGATLVITADGVQTSGGAGAPAEQAAPPADGTSFTVNVAEGDQRTMTMGELVQAYNEGVVNQETYVWADGMSDWLPLAQVESIVAALNAGSGAAPAPAAPYEAPPEPAYAPQAAYAAPAGYDAPPAYEAPPAEEKRAARRDNARGGAGRDLFATNAGVGEEMATNGNEIGRASCRE